MFGKSRLSIKAPEAVYDSFPESASGSTALHSIPANSGSPTNSSALYNELFSSDGSQSIDYAGNVFGFEMFLGASPIDNIAFHGSIFHLNSSTLSRETPSTSRWKPYDYQYNFGGLGMGFTTYSMPANLYFTFQGRVVTDGAFNILRPNPEYDPDLPSYDSNYQYGTQEKYAIESGNSLGYSISFGWEGRFASEGLAPINLGIAFQYAKDVLRLANYSAAHDLEVEHSLYGLSLSITFF